MDCNCNCFGIAASSKKPVKRYNLLVPDIFPKQPPPFMDHIDPSTERKLKKLYEYLEKNLHRGPKISRRLARKVNQELPRQQWGYVQLAVTAYIYLLEHLRDADSALFAKEVVCQLVAKPVHFYQKIVPAAGCVAGRADSFLSELFFLQGVDSDAGGVRAGQFNQSVAGVLLHHPAPEIGVLGAELLAAFIRQQATAEYLLQTEAFMDLLCHSALEHDESATGGALLRLQLVCLSSMQEQIRLCGRASASLKSLEKIVACLVEILASRGRGFLLAAQGLEVPHDSVVAVAATESSQMISLADTERDSLELARAALAVLQDLGRLVQVPAEGKRFVECVLQFADRRQAWDPHGEATASPALLVLKQVCKDEQQQYLAFSRLVAHSKSGSLLGPLQRASVVKTACATGMELPHTLASAALVLAVKEWAPCVAELDEPSEPEPRKLQESILRAITSLAARMHNAQHLLEALGGLAAKAAGQSTTSRAVLQCMQAAAEALEQLRGDEQGRAASMPQLLLQELLVGMLQWQPQQQSLAHSVLTRLLSVSSLREAQAHALLSAIWYQVTSRNTPQLFVSVSHTLTVGWGSVSPQKIALFAEALEKKALGLGPGAAPDVGDSQRLGILQLCRALWTRLAVVSVIETGALLGDSQGPLEEASHLRLMSEKLEQADGAPLFTDSALAAAELERQLGCIESSARVEDVRNIIRGAAQGAGSGKQAAKDPLPFLPLPVTSLQPRVPGAWNGGAGSRSHTATGEQDAGQRASRLLAAVRTHTTDQVASAPSRIRTMQDFIQASMVETRRLAAEGGKPEREASQVAARTGQALAFIDRLLWEKGVATEEPGRPLSVAVGPQNGFLPTDLAAKMAGVPGDENKSAVRVEMETASHNRLAT